MSTKIVNYLHLSLKAPEGSNKSLSLYLKATEPKSAVLNLMVFGPQPFNTNKSLNIYLKGISVGATSSFKSLPLYINCDKPTASLSLFIQVDPNDHGSTNNLLYLFTKGTWYSASNSLNLMVSGGQGGGIYQSKSLGLYIKGAGKTPGYFLFNSNLYLYVEVKNGVSQSLNLSMAVNNTISSSLPLYLYGVTGMPNNSINLYLAAKASLTKILNLFIRGM